MDAALQHVAEQRAELLAVAHAVSELERTAQRARRQADRERRLRAPVCAAVGAPCGAQHAGRARLARRGRH